MGNSGCSPFYLVNGKHTDLSVKNGRRRLLQHGHLFMINVIYYDLCDSFLRTK